ncbi:hypothetical protein [Asticcacaulis solisilvae]|uniref:hypothetical protein n=1 Tax=Asticcacaulis solisilvae TaxID=1217274 RepID=UPI003FD8EDBB
MTDEELQRQFFDRDGLWSNVTKTAMSRFKTDRVELDANWAGTPTWWTCPGCGRDKAKIFRLSSKNVLLARLDWHHDHLEDRLKLMLKAEFGDQWVNRVLSATGRLQDRLDAMIARFEPGLVCIDCNNVDGRVKAEFKDISPWLSFSPREISTFIAVRPNAEHQVDFKAARALYDVILPKITAREALLSHVVGMIAAGELDQERASSPPHRGDLLRRHMMQGFLESSSRFEIEEDIAAFEGRSLSRDAAATARTTKHRVTVEAPSPEEVAAYDGGGGAEGLWREAPADWRCPGCGRNRIEILRRSKNRKRKWSGKMLRHTEYVCGETFDEDQDTYDETIDHEVTHVICSDCASIAPEVKRRNADLSTGNLLLQLRDMKAVLTSKPNQPHEVDWPAAAQRLRQSERLRYLVTSYQADRSNAFDCLARYNEALALCNHDPARTKRMMIDAWARIYGLPKDAAEVRIRYLLKRAKYLGKADTGKDLKLIRNSRGEPSSSPEETAQPDEMASPE